MVLHKTNRVALEFHKHLGGKMWVNLTFKHLGLNSNYLILKSEDKVQKACYICNVRFEKVFSWTFMKDFSKQLNVEKAKLCPYASENCFRFSYFSGI